MVDFMKNYTFEAQKEIHSEYYHSGQVSIFVHVLYIHAQKNVDDITSTNDNRHVIRNTISISAMTACMIHIMYNIVLILFMVH